METVEVTFRKWKGGDVIALFPYVKADVQGRYCQSYMHVGQHGAADYIGLQPVTIPASPQEYADLKQELESIGYALKIVKRANRRRIATC